MRAKISVIIPVYNVAPYVEECISSVLRQDYENLEIIIVDDCGTDNSMQLVESLVSNCRRDVILKRHERNRGLSATRNTGILLATGDYLFFLDSDDHIEPDCLSALMRTAETYPKADVIYGSTERVPAEPGWEHESIVNRTDLKEYYDSKTQIRRMILTDFPFPIGVWNRLIKRSWLLEHSLFFKEGIIYEDVHWNFFLAKYINAIALCKKTTHYYRYNPNGILTNARSRERVYYDRLLKDWVRHVDFHTSIFHLYAIFRLAHTNYMKRYGGGSRPAYIRIFYSLIYLVRLWRNSVD